MRTALAALLFVLPLAADSTSINLSAPLIVYQDQSNAQYTPLITLTPDGFSVSVAYTFDQNATDFELALEESFSLAQPTEVALDYTATALLSGGACSHGFCPGMDVGINGFSQIASAAPVLLSAAGSSSTPYFGIAQASGDSSSQWLLDAGTYQVFQFVQFTASDAGVSSSFGANLGFTITDPPAAVPEPVGVAPLGLLVLSLTAALVQVVRGATQESRESGTSIEY
jgi:hypothetical protein